MSEEEKSHGEHHHKEYSVHKSAKVKKIAVWKTTTTILGILLIISLYFNFLGRPTNQAGNEMPINKAADEAVTYINNYLLQPGTTATLKGKTDVGDLYNIKIDLGGREYDSYVTKDGRLLFPSAVDLKGQPDIAPNPPTNQPIEVSTDDDPSLGPEDAKVTVIEFSDFECPYCGATAGTHDILIGRFKSQDPTWEAAVPKLKELAKQGKIRFVFRDFPLSGHRNAQKASEAAQCANDQNKFWEYHDKLFENQDTLDVTSLKKYAAELSLETTTFNECLDSDKYEKEVKDDFKDGSVAGVSGTPAFFVNGKLISGAQPFEVFEQIIEDELAK